MKPTQILPTSFRLKPPTVRLIAKLSRVMRIPKTAVVELALAALEREQRAK